MCVVVSQTVFTTLICFNLLAINNSIFPLANSSHPFHRQLTCSLGAYHGYEHGYETMSMGTGTSTGTRPWLWICVQDHGYVSGMWQSHRYRYGMRLWVWVRIQDHGYGYHGYESRMPSHGCETVGTASAMATKLCTLYRYTYYRYG